MNDFKSNVFVFGVFKVSTTYPNLGKTNYAGLLDWLQKVLGKNVPLTIIDYFRLNALVSLSFQGINYLT